MPDPSTRDQPDRERSPRHGTLAARRIRRRARRAWPRLRWPLAGLAALLGLVAGLGAWLWVTTELPSEATLAESALVIDRNGQEIAVLSRDGMRLSVDLDDLPAHVAGALVAAEDRDFFGHRGVDPSSIARALWNNLRDDDVEGGSTITQQLVKNEYLDHDRTLDRKLREAVLAVKLERSADKHHILERYLNTVYFGRGAHGIEAGARAWFAKSASDLTSAESALLVGLLHAPGSYDAELDPDRLRDRRDRVLRAMETTGALDPTEAATARRTPVDVAVAPSPTQLTAGVAPHFVERVRDEVADLIGDDALYRDGLVIHTTLDLTDQRAAEAAVASALDDPDDPQAALIGVDRSGAVRAWVGGRSFAELQLDLVSDDAGTGRQPGSTFKPIVLAANLTAGNGAGMPFDAPSQVTLTVSDPPWQVSNADGRGLGELTLAEATVRSVNTVYAQAVLQVGAQTVADLAARLGVSSPLEARPSIALGTEEVTPLELATVYSTFARGGTRTDPFLVERIEDSSGRTLFERHEAPEQRVLDPAVAHTVSAVLAEVPRSGTATRAAIDRPMAAKTGTTQRGADAWLAGYTPEYTAVVWVGHASGNQPMGAVDGAAVYGGTVPAQIWHDFMIEALRDVPPTAFPPGDAELLGDTSDPVALGGPSDAVAPGEEVTFVGTGLVRCANGWDVAVSGPDQPPADTGDGGRSERGEPTDSTGNDEDEDEERRGRKKHGKHGRDDDGDREDDRRAPISVRGPVEPGGIESRRTTTLRLPDHAESGRYRAVAHCDAGAGRVVVASTSFDVRDRARRERTDASGSGT